MKKATVKRGVRSGVVRKDLLVSINAYSNKEVRVELGGPMGASRSVAENLIRMMFPFVRIEHWERSEIGWSGTGVVASFSFPEPQPAG